MCPYAHSNEESEEKNRRFNLQHENPRCASQSGLMSFPDKIYQEYQEASSFATVFTDSLCDVDVNLDKKKKQRITLKDDFVWLLKITCKDSAKKLNHAAFIKLSSYPNFFSIRVVHGKKKSSSKEHIDFAVGQDSSNKININNKQIKFEVKFKPKAYGRCLGRLAFEFNDSTRPVLLVKFEVDVTETIDVERRPFTIKKEEEIISWERNREIIPWKQLFQTDYEKFLVDLTQKYKPPKAALEYSAESEAFRPDKLTVDNYVNEMHKFLYREENARSETLSGPRKFSVAVTENYVSSNKRLRFAEHGQLFAIFELPSYLDRDTDEGLLILDSCTKVLIGKDTSSPVYEILIEEKFHDHIILLVSEQCIKDWKLKSGDVLEAEIQFQLNREKFCVCHHAVDQLKKQNKLALVCPDAHAVRERIHTNDQYNDTSLDLDQKSVLKFIDSPNRDVLPLFVVQGSFGTGKTHTICHCVMHLFENKPDTKILICTHANSAANIYIENNFRNVDKWKKHVVRIVFHGRRLNTVSELERNYCLWREDNRGFRYPTAQDVASHRIFITTFETALALGLEETGLVGSFTHIFLDEAAQVMEAVAIIPLTLADSKKTKVLIAGDHKQMTEKIYSKDQGRVSDNAVLTDSNFTLLERIYRIYSKNHSWIDGGNNFSFDESNLVVLRNNYRCAEPILRLIEDLFYRKKLFKSCSNEPPLEELQPIQFHNVEGTCEQDFLSSGHYNKHEANQCVEIVRNLLRDHSSRLQQKDIIVVASYKEQVELLRSGLRGKDLHKVAASRVHNIQGMEYKVVVLSCVHRQRSKSDVEGKNYGLLSDANLLNTAFTRSKLAIIAVGHAATLCSLGKYSVLWTKFLKFCENKSSLYPPMSVSSIQRDVMMPFKLNPEAHAFHPSTSSSSDQPFDQVNQSNSPDNTSVVSNDYNGSDNEENLPLPDEILDDIIKNSGYNPNKMIITVDSQGIEYATNISDGDDRSRKKILFPLLQNEYLNHRLRSNKDSFKRCRIFMTSWYSAVADVLDRSSDIQTIKIDTKVGLGQSFHQDEVVVQILKSQEIEKNSGKRQLAFGKVIGILSRFQNPKDRKFICVPDKTSPNVMCPIDKKVTKFICLKPKHEDSNKKGCVTICKLTSKNKIEKVRFVPYDVNSTSDNSWHFVVKYLEWPPSSKYPVGYVSGAIKPKDYEKYYSLAYDVPSADHKKDIKEEAEIIAKKELSYSTRIDLTHLYVFTIDPKESKYLDDALSLEKCKEHENCWKIGVHITDVGSIVPAENKVNRDAERRVITHNSRGESRKVSHMLPTNICVKCSLLADGNNKLAISTFFHSACLPDICCSAPDLNSERNIPLPSLTVIRPQLQMDYEEAETYLREVKQRGVRDFETAKFDNLPDQLYIIWRTMLKLRRKRLDSAMFMSEPDFNKIKEFYKETTSHMLIEECMITLNACTALFLQKKGNCDFFLRVQEAPNKTDWKKWMNDHEQDIKMSLFQQSSLEYLSGHPPLVIDSNDPSHSSCSVQINPQVWEEIEDAIQRKDVESALLLFSSDSLQPRVISGYSKFKKIQRKAVEKPFSELKKQHTTDSCTHFSLRLPLYARASSPIRRYLDIVVQRLLVEKCTQTQKSHRDSNVVVLQHRGQNTLDILKINQRIANSLEYEKRTRNVSFARSLISRQICQQAYLTEIGEKGLKLEYLDLHDLPISAYFLEYNHLQLLSQEPTKIVWKIRYYDLHEKQERKDNSNEESLILKSSTSDSVTMETWQALVKAIKEMTSKSTFPLDDNKERLFSLFKNALDSRKESISCPRRHAMGGPCNNDECRKEQANCKDVLCHKSKTGIYHYRKITMSLRLGMPMSVQLYCDVQQDVHAASIQTLALTKDFDICFSHLRSPVEVFASEVRPSKRDRFDTLQEYKKYWMQLHRMDGVYNSVKDSGNSITLKNVEVTFFYSAGNLKGNFSVKSSVCDERLILIYEDDFLCLRIEKKIPNDEGPEERSVWVGHAIVDGVNDSGQGKKRITRVTLRMCPTRVSSPKPPDDDLTKTHLATVEVIMLGASHRLIANTLKIVDRDRKNKEVLGSLCLDHRLQHFDDTDAVNDVCDSVGTNTIPGMKSNLNEEQIKRIKLALKSKVSLIQGPPGTGKSFVGAHLIYYFDQLNMAKNGKPGKIFYCGPSNKSVDVVAKYLLMCKMKVLRVYGTTHEEQDFPNPLKPSLPFHQSDYLLDKKSRSIFLHHKIRSSSNPYKDKIDMLDQLFKSGKKVRLADFEAYKDALLQAKIYEICKHDVIIATCATSSTVMKTLENYFGDDSEPKKEKSKKSKKGKNKKPKKDKNKYEKVIFTQCIIDECGMCSEPETLCPIIASEANQVVLIGDHKQLQPIIICDRAKEFGLGVSMFERLNERAGMLTRQYRMNPEICQFPSKKFYEDKLITDESVIKREKKKSLHFCYPSGKFENTAIFCHIVGEEITNYSLERGGENSNFNSQEAQAVIKILTYLHLQKHVPLVKIMILSPYTAQVHIIKTLIKKERSQMKGVHVGTVVSSQGSESDYVILSTVRSQPDYAIEEEASLHWRRKYIGFVTDPHQINVAITRAKSGLCIVGNKNLLSKDTDTWKQLLDSYSARGSVVNFDDPNAPWNRTH